MKFLINHNWTRWSQSVGSLFFVNKGSITILNAWSIILGINSFNNGDDSSRQGLVLISINHGFNYSSNIKSYPKISNEYLHFLNVF